MLTPEVQLNTSQFRREDFRKLKQQNMGRRSLKNAILLLVFGTLSFSFYMVFIRNSSSPIRKQWNGVVSNMKIDQQDDVRGRNPVLQNEEESSYEESESFNDHLAGLHGVFDKAKEFILGGDEYPGTTADDFGDSDQRIKADEGREEVVEGEGGDTGVFEEEEGTQVHPNVIGDEEFAEEKDADAHQDVMDDEEFAEEEGTEVNQNAIDDEEFVEEEGTDVNQNVMGDEEGGRDFPNKLYDNEDNNNAVEEDGDEHLPNIPVPNMDKGEDREDDANNNNVPEEYLIRNREGRIVGEKLFGEGINAHMLHKQRDPNYRESPDRLNKDMDANARPGEIRGPRINQQLGRLPGNRVLQPAAGPVGRPQNEDLLNLDNNRVNGPFLERDPAIGLGRHSEWNKVSENKGFVDRPIGQSGVNPFLQKDSDRENIDFHRDAEKHSGQGLGVLLRPFGQHGVNPMLHSETRVNYDDRRGESGHKIGESQGQGFGAFGLDHPGRMGQEDSFQDVLGNKKQFHKLMQVPPNQQQEFLQQEEMKKTSELQDNQGGMWQQGAQIQQQINQEVEDPEAAKKKAEMLQQQQEQEELRRKYHLQLQQQNNQQQLQQQQLPLHQVHGQDELRENYNLQQQQQQQDNDQEILRQKFLRQQLQQQQQQQKIYNTPELEKQQQPPVATLQQPLAPVTEVGAENLKLKERFFIEDLTVPLLIKANCIDFKYPTGTAPLCIHSEEKDVMSAKLGADGFYEQDIMNQLTFIMASEPSLGLIDIGAGFGVYTIGTALMGRRVLAVEPLFRNYRLLHKTAQENEVQRLITMVAQALDNETYVGRLSYSDQSGGYSNVHITRLTPGMATDRANTVHVTTLNSLVEVIPFRRALMKLDVNEGLEVRILQASYQFFESVEVPYIITHWSVTADSSRHASMFALLSGLGYHPKLAWNGADINVQHLKNDMSFVVWKKQ